MLLVLTTLFISNVYGQSTGQPMIHGRPVSAECLAAYKNQFAPEHQRVEAIQTLTRLVVNPPELMRRAHAAAGAMLAYQTVLDTIDAKLADSLTMEDKTNLENAQKEQSDVGPALKEIGKMVEAPGFDGTSELKAAYIAWKQSREIELKAAASVDAACPDDLE